MQYENIISYITSYNRETQLKRIVNEHLKNNVDFIIVDDGSEFINDPYWNNYNVCKLEHKGKKGFIDKFNKIFNHFIKSDYDSIMVVADDLYNIDFDYIKMIATTNLDQQYFFNLLTDYRKMCWNLTPPEYLDKNIEKVYFTDCTFLSNKLTIIDFQKLTISDNWFNTESKSSGVGKAMTDLANKLDIPIYRRIPSIVTHDDGISVMHSEERIKNPLLSINDIYVVIAAYNTHEYIKDCLDSIKNQTLKCKILLGIDGCEKTLDKVKDILYEYDNLEVYYFKENMGTYITFNSLMQFVPKQSLVIRFDSDDKMLPNMVEMYYSLYPCCTVMPGTVSFTKETFDKLGGFMPWRCAGDTEFRKRLFYLIPDYNIVDKELMFKRTFRENSLMRSGNTKVGGDVRKKHIDYIQNLEINETNYNIDCVTNDSYEKITKSNIKIVCNIATMNSRKESLKKTLKSLKKQTIIPDKINVYNNDIENEDYTDNAKFVFLQEFDEPVYYFTMDDDIIYGEDYIEKTIRNIEKNKCIITYHGRILNDKFEHYYSDHFVFSCKKKYGVKVNVDVPGTGVTAFRTDYFNPTDVYKHEYKRMSDCLLGLEAAKNNKKIVLVSDFNKPILEFNEENQEDSCFSKEYNNTEKQNEICKKIYEIKKESHMK